MKLFIGIGSAVLEGKMGGERALRERLTRTEILVGLQASQSSWACTPSAALDPL